jgi:CBS domain-containing protein
MNTIMLVRDLMTLGVLTCSPDTPIDQIARLLLEQCQEAIVVLEGRNAEGYVSQDDLILSYLKPDPQKLTAADIMNVKLPQVPADIPIITAAQLMLDNKLRILYITHHAGGVEYPAAFISFQQILRHLAARNEEELRSLGVKAARQSPLDVFIERRDRIKQSRISHAKDGKK